MSHDAKPQSINFPIESHKFIVDGPINAGDFKSSDPFLRSSVWEIFNFDAIIPQPIATSQQPATRQILRNSQFSPGRESKIAQYLVFQRLAPRLKTASNHQQSCRAALPIHQFSSLTPGQHDHKFLIAPPQSTNRSSNHLNFKTKSLLPKPQTSGFRLASGCKK